MPDAALTFSNYPWPRARTLHADPREPDYDEKNNRLVSTVLDSVGLLSRCYGRPQSARFVNFYRANRDPNHVATVSAHWLFSLPATFTQGAGRNLARFESQIRDAAAQLRRGQSLRITEDRDARVLSQSYSHETDHYTALVSFTIKSSAHIVVSKEKNGSISLGDSSVQHQLLDRYDWRNPVAICGTDANQKIELSERNFQDYESAGRATPFFVRSEPALSTPSFRPDGKIVWTTTDNCGHVLTQRQPLGMDD